LHALASLYEVKNWPSKFAFRMGQLLCRYVLGVSRGVSQHAGAVSSCDDDAGYVLYQTAAFFYLGGAVHVEERVSSSPLTLS
jgi:hypothetical protein